MKAPYPIPHGSDIAARSKTALPACWSSATKLYRRPVHRWSWRWKRLSPDGVGRRERRRSPLRCSGSSSRSSSENRSRPPGLGRSLLHSTTKYETDCRKGAGLRRSVLKRLRDLKPLPTFDLACNPSSSGTSQVGNSERPETSPHISNSPVTLQVQEPHR